MQEKGYEMKQGKYLMLKNDRNEKLGQNKKTLGIHYSEKSIEYRIANKDFKPVQNLLFPINNGLIKPRNALGIIKVWEGGLSHKI